MPKRFQQGCIDVIALDDRLSAEVVGEIEGVVAEALSHGLPQIILDLRRVRVVDSAGLEWLYGTHEICRHRGGSLRLASASPLVRDILRVTGIGDEIGVCGNILEAAGEFAQ